MLSNVDQFDKGYESILKHLDSLRERLTSVATLQPDLEAKRTQSDQLKVNIVCGSRGFLEVNVLSCRCVH